MLDLSTTTHRRVMVKKMSASPEKRVVNKYRRAYIRQLKEREYKRLRAVVPTLAKQQHVKKLTVIEEAIRYIDQLHNTLVNRIHITGSDESMTTFNEHSVITATHELFLQKQKAKLKAPLQPCNDVNIWHAVPNNGSMTSSRDVTRI